MTLQRIAEAVLAALTKSPLLALDNNTFSALLDGRILEPSQNSSSALDVIHYLQGTQGHACSGCQAQVDKGLLTVIFADVGGLQVIAYLYELLLSRPLQSLAFDALSATDF